MTVQLAAHLLNGRPVRHNPYWDQVVADAKPSRPARPTAPALGQELRINTFAEYVGQTALKVNLQKRIQASRISGRQFDHMFLAAAPGYGKTTLCAVVADELGVPLTVLKCSPHMTERELLRTVRSCARPGLLLLDEIHSAPKIIQEMLLPVIDEGYIANKAGKMEPIDGLTFCAATTEANKVIRPLLERFRNAPHFVDYTDDELSDILLGMARRLDVPISPELAQELAPAAAMTPRIAGALVTAARDLHDIGDELTAANILDLAGFDPDGLSHNHLSYLRALDDLGGASGIKNIVMMLQLPLPTAEGLERLLIKRQLITLEVTGREITGAGMRKVGVPAGLIRS